MGRLRAVKLAMAHFWKFKAKLVAKGASRKTGRRPWRPTPKLTKDAAGESVGEGNAATKCRTTRSKASAHTDFDAAHPGGSPASPGSLPAERWCR